MNPELQKLVDMGCAVTPESQDTIKPIPFETNAAPKSGSSAIRENAQTPPSRVREISRNDGSQAIPTRVAPVVVRREQRLPVVEEKSIDAAPVAAPPHILQDFIALAKSVAAHPDYETLQHYKLCNFSGGKGNRIRKAVVALGLLEGRKAMERVKEKGGRPPVILSLTEKGRNWLDEKSRNQAAPRVVVRSQPPGGGASRGA